MAFISSRKKKASWSRLPFMVPTIRAWKVSRTGWTPSSIISSYTSLNKYPLKHTLQIPWELVKAQHRVTQEMRETSELAFAGRWGIRWQCCTRRHCWRSSSSRTPPCPPREAGIWWAEPGSGHAELLESSNGTSGRTDSAFDVGFKQKPSQKRSKFASESIRGSIYRYWGSSSECSWRIGQGKENETSVPPPIAVSFDLV